MSANSSATSHNQRLALVIGIFKPSLAGFSDYRDLLRPVDEQVILGSMRYSTRQGSSEYLKLLGYKRYHYLAWPRVSSTRLVLLHALGECADIWTAFANSLAGSADIVAFDLRGHGGTPWDPDTDYEIADYVDDLRLQIGHWSRPSVLVGHGLGAQIAIEAARELGDLVTALVLIDPDSGADAADTLVQQLAADDGSFGDALRQHLVRELTWARPGGGRTPKCDPAALEHSSAGSAQGEVTSIDHSALVISSKINGTEAPASELKPTQHASVPTGGWPHINSAAETAEATLRFLQALDA